MDIRSEQEHVSLFKFMLSGEIFHTDIYVTLHRLTVRFHKCKREVKVLVFFLLTFLLLFFCRWHYSSGTYSKHSHHSFFFSGKYYNRWMSLARQIRQLLSKCFDFLHFCTCHCSILTHSDHRYFDEVSIDS